MPTTITHVNANFVREPLIKPFGFKGGYVADIWQVFAGLTSSEGHTSTGVGVQSVLWSDAGVFAAHSEAGGNALMFATTEFALQRILGETFEDPIALQELILEDVDRAARRFTDSAALRKTFALNALVAVDNAAWLLHAQTHGISSFDELIPPPYRPALAHRHTHVASIPIVSYNTAETAVLDLLEEGYFFLKFKLGSPGDQDAMLANDIKRFERLHTLLKDRNTSHTANGRLPYYLDANGRYESKDTLRKFLDHADHIGALDRIAFIEEPFPETLHTDVSDLGVCIAADESAHTVDDAIGRMDLGYRAIALKPIAKTLSMTLKIALAAHERNIPCFCADLTVNPLLVDWNKAIASRLAPFPGFTLGLLEANGHQNYRNWETMKEYLADKNAPWVQPKKGVFEIPASFYEDSRHLLEAAPRVLGLVF